MAVSSWRLQRRMGNRARFRLIWPLPATISMKGDEITFRRYRRQYGGWTGQDQWSGRWPSDLSVALTNLPLALANTFGRSYLGGTVNGTARITGTKEAT